MDSPIRRSPSARRRFGASFLPAERRAGTTSTLWLKNQRSIGLPWSYAGALFWPVVRAEEVLTTWSQWTATVPDEVTSLGRILNLPPIPQIPEPLRGRSFVVVEGAYLGNEEKGAEFFRPLRALGAEIDTFATIGVPALGDLHLDPHHPVAALGDGTLLSGFPREAVDALVAVAGRPLKPPQE